MTEPLKYCKDCKYFRESTTSNTALDCTHPDINQPAPIARRTESLCGEAAIKFDPK